MVDVIRKSDVENDTNPHHHNLKSSFFMQVRSSEEEWKLQGIKFYRKKCFDQAIKCFIFAGEKLLAARCDAYMEAEKGQKNVLEIERIEYRLSQD